MRHAKTLLVAVTLSVLPALPSAAHEPEYTTFFNFRDCGGFATTGRNPYWVLEPGYRLVLEGDDDGETKNVVITVLDETERVGGVLTRVVEERERADGEIVEISRNYMAICQRNNSIVYFGEDVDNYEDGVVINHNGSFRAGSNGARAGVLMPGLPLHGARHYQELAPGEALDRAEILSLSEVVDTPAGRFERCLRVRETTPLEPDAVDFKLYAPGIGLIQDATLQLVEYGFDVSGDDDDDDDDQ
jgi:hypothetical protein